MKQVERCQASRALGRRRDSEIEGLRPIFNEVLFLDMTPASGEYEPLIG